eukprot:3142070-Rhodomonas_salina.3
MLRVSHPRHSLSLCCPLPLALTRFTAPPGETISTSKGSYIMPCIDTVEEIDGFEIQVKCNKDGKEQDAANAFAKKQGQAALKAGPRRLCVCSQTMLSRTHSTKAPSLSHRLTPLDDAEQRSWPSSVRSRRRLRRAERRAEGLRSPLRTRPCPSRCFARALCVDVSMCRCVDVSDGMSGLSPVLAVSFALWRSGALTLASSARDAQSDSLARAQEKEKEKDKKNSGGSSSGAKGKVSLQTSLTPFHTSYLDVASNHA